MDNNSSRKLGEALSSANIGIGNVTGSNNTYEFGV